MSNEVWDEQVVASEDTGAMPDMDVMFGRHLDMDDVRRTQADSLKPVGTYITSTLTLAPEVEGPLDYNGNPNPRKGRVVFRYYGPAVLTATEKTAPALKVAVGTEIKGYFTFRISPDRFNWEDGSPDTQSKLWSQAVKAYQAAYKSDPTNHGQVAHFLRDYPVRLRVIQKNTKEDAKGEPRNDIVAISAVSEQG